MQTFIEGKGSVREIPDTVFMVSYTNENYPDHYRHPGISFDNIKIPLRDAFGIETSLGEKNYTLVGQTGLQKNVDYINATFTSEDRAVVRQFVREQKDLKQKKRLGIIDKKDGNKKDDEDDNDENKDENSDKKENSDKETPKNDASKDDKTIQSAPDTKAKPKNEK
jgi:hypothetical protein